MTADYKEQHVDREFLNSLVEAFRIRYPIKARPQHSPKFFYLNHVPWRPEIERSDEIMSITIFMDISTFHELLDENPDLKSQYVLSRMRGEK